MCRTSHSAIYLYLYRCSPLQFLLYMHTVFCLPDSWASWKLTSTHYDCLNSWLVGQSVICYTSGLSARLLDPSSIITLHQCWPCTFYCHQDRYCFRLSDTRGFSNFQVSLFQKWGKKMDWLFLQNFPGLCRTITSNEEGRTEIRNYCSVHVMHSVLCSVDAGVNLIIYCFEVIFFLFPFIVCFVELVPAGAL